MSALRHVRGLSLGWALAALAMVLFIWGNSLVPGEGSSSLSLSVLAFARGALSSAGLPSTWLTHFIVRKTAHFTEYAVLGVLVSQAFGPSIARSRRALVPVALILALVPSVDETIQLFIDGRSGQVTDVLLDCCGAATGAFLRHLVFLARSRKAVGSGNRAA